MAAVRKSYASSNRSSEKEGENNDVAVSIQKSLPHHDFLSSEEFGGLRATFMGSGMVEKEYLKPAANPLAQTNPRDQAIRGGEGSHDPVETEINKLYKVMSKSGDGKGFGTPPI